MYKCKHCSETFEKTSSMASHSRWCFSNPNSKKRKHGLCITCKCGIQFSLISPKDRRTTCSIECQRSKTESVREIISEKRIKYLLEHPESHVWKRKDKFKSVPCEKVKEYLNRNDILFVEEYTPLENRNYSIDIAFPNLKIGVEINGNQHYDKNGELKPYYKTRHDLIEKSGWRLIEIHYSLCFDENNIKKFIDFDIPYNSNDDIQRILECLNEKKIKVPSLPRGETVKRETDKRWEPIKNSIFEHGIDFTKFGWVGKVSKVLGINVQHVNMWMKRYHLDFYTNNCFKRKQRSVVRVNYGIPLFCASSLESKSSDLISR